MKSINNWNRCLVNMLLEERLNTLLGDYVEHALDCFKGQIIRVQIIASELEKKDKKIIITALEDSFLYNLFCLKHSESRTNVPLAQAVHTLMKTGDMVTEMNELRERYFLHSLHCYDPYQEQDIPFCNIRKLFDALRAIDPNSPVQKHFAERLLGTDFDYYGLGHRKVKLISNLRESQATAMRLLDTLLDGNGNQMYGLDEVIESIILMDDTPPPVEEYLKHRIRNMKYHAYQSTKEINKLGFMVLTLLDYGEEKAVELYSHFPDTEQGIWDKVYDQDRDKRYLKKLLRTLTASEYNVDEWAGFIWGLQKENNFGLRKKDQQILNSIKKGSTAQGCKELPELFELLSLEIREYKSIKKIGRGSSGSTYLAYSDELKKYRAVKVIDQETVNPNEAILMARIGRVNLENIVQIHEAGHEIATVDNKKRYAILMEYVDGQTLEEILHERKLTLHEVLDYSAQILNGIKSLRKHGITHRDLKPKNIKVNTQGEVKILDFGIATDEPHPEARNNQEFGAPKNMEADDLISFGLLVYKMATGKNLIDVPGKEPMGHDVYTDEIDRIKQFLYRDGKIIKEYAEKIEALTVLPMWITLMEGTSLQHVSSIINSALNDRDLNELIEKYPFLHRYNLMDAKELRQLVSKYHLLSETLRIELGVQNWFLEIRSKEHGT